MISQDADHADLASSLRWDYRPQLDGLRALAVYLVVAFHAGLGRFVGGFIGVDVFFVLSGYLVTQLLLRDLHGFGSIALRQFYSRRFRRLLPAAFAVLLVSAAVFAALASPSEVQDAVGAVRSAFLYVSNWFFIDQATDYFGADINASPVLHFWSLSVEEQFYAFWPLLLLGLYLVTRPARHHQWKLIRGAVALGAAASVIAALRLADTNFNRAYYGTDTRAYQLLAGALIAMTPALLSFGERQRRWMERLAVPSLLALVFLATSFVGLGPIGRGIAVVLTTSVLIVAIENSDRGPVKRVLSSAPLVYLGKISYGTYIWHWVVVIVAARLLSVSPIATAGITVLVATGLASLSFQLLERPVRESRLLDLHRSPVIALGLLTSVVGGLVVVPRLLDDAGASRVAARSTIGAVGGAAPVPAGLDWRAAKRDSLDFPECLGAPLAECTVVQGRGEHILLMGDSHARRLMPLLADIAKRNSLSLSVAVAPICPWQESLFVLYLDASDCRKRKQDWYERMIPELDPDIVVVSHRAFDDPKASIDILGPTGGLANGTPKFRAGIRDASIETISRLRNDARKVVIVEPIPIAPFDPVDCLSKAKFLEECRYVANDVPTPLELDFRALAEQEEGVWSLDIDRLVCPYLPICDPVVGGLIVKRDQGHLTTNYALALATDVERYLTENDILKA